MKTLILQSYNPQRVNNWLHLCMDSVRQWAAIHNYEYTFAGNEIFSAVPDWYMQKVGGRMPIAADLARLLWIDQLLAEERADTIVWLDADVLVFAPESWKVQLSRDAQFGVEYWLQHKDGGTDHAATENRKRAKKIYRNVHNAYCAFKTGSSTLKFLIDVVQHQVKEVDARYMPPQFVGPKLLTSLHNTVQFDLQEHVGAISPLLAEAVRLGDVETLNFYQRRLKQPIYAANLCASLALEQDAQMLALVQKLLAQKGLGTT